MFHHATASPGSLRHVATPPHRHFLCRAVLAGSRILSRVSETTTIGDRPLPSGKALAHEHTSIVAERAFCPMLPHNPPSTNLQLLPKASSIDPRPYSVLVRVASEGIQDHNLIQVLVEHVECGFSEFGGCRAPSELCQDIVLQRRVPAPA